MCSVNASLTKLLRPPEYVMRPENFGAARSTRYSFSRTMLRRAKRDGWKITLNQSDLNELGEGEIVYEIFIDDRVFSFFALTATVDESAHTDRVIAERWEITAVLCEGRLDDEFLQLLRRQVPLQENARLDSRVLVLTRGNRSVRFFQYLVDILASGSQPAPELVADAGYIMRSTAFYGNGKFGMRSFEGYELGHPLAASYRAQFLCAWLFRELSYLLVEHCAKAKGGDEAVAFDQKWKRYFGLGNATGLGLVPYAYKHPRIIDAWVRTREKALAHVRLLPADELLTENLTKYIKRATKHFAVGTEEDCSPFMNSKRLAECLLEIDAAFNTLKAEAWPYDALYNWATNHTPEMVELVVSLLIELHDGDDEEFDQLLTVEESTSINPKTEIAEIVDRIDRHFAWLDSLDLASEQAYYYFWLLTDNTEEPRRAARQKLPLNGCDIPIGVALSVAELKKELSNWRPDETLGALIAAKSELRFAIETVMNAVDYGQTHDNAFALDYMPLMIQRFQLAMYGMDNFKPKSTDWLRVTLYQGAPRVEDLAGAANEQASFEHWIWPERPD